MWHQKYRKTCTHGAQIDAKMDPKWSQKRLFFATLSKPMILKDVCNEITTFLVQDPPEIDSKSKPKTALENNAPKSHPTCENGFILGPH